MPKHARSLLAGTIAAIPLWILASGPATSQSTAANDQVQLGDVFAGQRLDVVTADNTTATTTATGNAISGAVNAGDLAIRSSQSLNGAVGALTTVNVSQYSGSAILTTAATGNTGDAAITSGGTLSGTFVQSAAGGGISAVGNLNAGNAQVGQAATNAQAIANSQGFAADGSAVGAGVSQLNTADTTATGRVHIGYLPGAAYFTAAAVGNNVTSVGADGAAQSLGIAQSNQSSTVQAVQTAGIGSGQSTLTNATASANNVNVANTAGPVGVAVNQDNSAYVLGYASDTSLQFGSATTSAQATGNSTFVANVGPSVALDNVQSNGVAGVESSANFQGGAGFDTQIASTAIGNGATASVCSQCGGVLDVNNSQTNLGSVTARGVLGISGLSRSVAGTTTAVGNSGTFYVTSPGH